MALTNTEKQQRFKQRMLEAGFMQKQIWIRRDPEKRPAKMDMRSFAKRMEKLTAGWSEEDLSTLLTLLVKITEARSETMAQKNK